MTWNWDPLIAAALLLPGWMYAHGVMVLWRRKTGHGISKWQVLSFCLGMIVLFAALVSPIDTLGEQLLYFHMIQHLLLMLIAPPLLVLGTPPGIFLWVFPLGIRRRIGRQTMPGTSLHGLWKTLTHPVIAWILHAAAIWVWHIPGLYEAALHTTAVHILEHISFFGSALLFWYAALQRGRDRPFLGALMIFTTALHSSVLGALMTFAGSVWYPLYIERAPAYGLSALEDQQLAGLLMWVPSGIVYLVAVMILLGHGLQQMEQTTPATAQSSTSSIIARNSRSR